MKTINMYCRRKLLLTAICTVLLGMLVTSCSKDDNDEPAAGGSPAKTIAGSYKGKMTILNGPDAGDYYDAILIATAKNDSDVEFAPKSGEDYSAATPKVMEVMAPSGNPADGVIAQGPTGSVGYTPNDHNITLYTTDTNEADILFTFNGTKE